MINVKYDHRTNLYTVKLDFSHEQKLKIRAEFNNQTTQKTLSDLIVAKLEAIEWLH